MNKNEAAVTVYCRTIKRLFSYFYWLWVTVTYFVMQTIIFCDIMTFKPGYDNEITW